MAAAVPFTLFATGVVAHESLVVHRKHRSLVASSSDSAQGVGLPDPSWDIPLSQHRGRLAILYRRHHGNVERVMHRILMSKNRPPFPEPFDLALPEFYRAIPDMKRYRKLTEIGAEVGDPLAQYSMATWYLHGNVQLGIRKNIKKANALLEVSAAFLNRAAYDLAVSRLRGSGTTKDPKAAFVLFVRAANLGSLAALEAQAQCLAAGIGTKKDAQAARFLMRRVTAWKNQVRRVSRPRTRVARSSARR